MNIITKSSNGITLVPAETRLLTSRRVFIEGEINDTMALDFIKQIMLLVEDNSEEPITIYINSQGGSVNAGLLIYDTIVNLETPIRTVCLGKAYSMGAIILTCAPKRYILPNSEVMIHEPLIGNGVGGSTSTIKSVSDNLLETKKKLNKILSIHTGQTVRKVNEATKYDHYYDAEQAVKFGLVDEILNSSEVMKL